MDGETIERWQAAQLFKTVGPMVGYLYRLRERMDKSDSFRLIRLYQRVCRAYESLHALSELHYLSCDGVGRGTSR